MEEIEISLLDFEKAGSVSTIKASSALFGVDLRPDLISQVVNWQLAKRRAGTHKTKGISEVSGTTRKPYRQKGTGRARQGSLRSPQFRKGGIIFGPVVRSHGFSLNKKVRNLALKSALSMHAGEGSLFALKAQGFGSAKSSALLEWVNSYSDLKNKKKILVVLSNMDESLVKAASNLHRIKVLWDNAANVYDLLLHDCVILEQSSIKCLEERLL